jgi:hypothetical protein
VTVFLGPWPELSGKKFFPLRIKINKEFIFLVFLETNLQAHLRGEHYEMEQHRVLKSSDTWSELGSFGSPS